MRYFVIYAALSGTGIRDKYEGGYLNTGDLNLSLTIKNKLKEWLSRYETEHYNGFTDDNVINKLDLDGKEIALMIKNELSEVKVDYFSDARMTGEII